MSTKQFPEKPNQNCRKAILIGVRQVCSIGVRLQYYLIFLECQSKYNQYLVFGGYPEVALEKEQKEKMALLGDIKNSFLKKDIDESGISNRDAFFKLFTLLSGQIANLLNKNELANTIGIDNKTIDHYLTILRKRFHRIGETVLWQSAQRTN